MPNPALRTLVIADEVDGWEHAGFFVDRNELDEGVTWIGSVRVRLIGRSAAHPERRGIVAWEFDDVDDGAIDGVTTICNSDLSITPAWPSHLNGASRLDHVVMFSPDLDRTVRALRMNGFEPSRTRIVPGTEPEKKQVFFWAGDTIIELVAPTIASGTEAARLWGLAITSDDIDEAARRLGDALGPAKPAVQPGRRIATVRTADLEISTAIALMTPHVEAGEPDA